MKEEGATERHIAESGVEGMRKQSTALSCDEIQALKELARRNRIVLEYEAADRTNHKQDMLFRLVKIPAYSPRTAAEKEGGGRPSI